MQLGEHGGSGGTRRDGDGYGFLSNRGNFALYLFVNDKTAVTRGRAKEQSISTNLDLDSNFIIESRNDVATNRSTYK